MVLEQMFTTIQQINQRRYLMFSNRSGIRVRYVNHDSILLFITIFLALCNHCIQSEPDSNRSKIGFVTETKFGNNCPEQMMPSIDRSVCLIKVEVREKTSRLTVIIVVTRHFSCLVSEIFRYIREIRVKIDIYK